MAEITFIPGCFAFAKQPGHPYWPCVVYNRWDEIPPEHSQRLKKPLAPKEDEVIVFWIEEWSFSVVKKKAVKGTDELEAAGVVKEAKSATQRKKLQAAIDSMREMESSGVDEGVEAAVVRPGQQPPPPPVPAPEASASAAAAGGAAPAASEAAAKGGSKKGAGGGGKGKNGAAAPATAAEVAAPALRAGGAGADAKPAAASSNNKKRKKATDAPAAQAVAAPQPAPEAPAPTPAAKQPAKRSKKGGAQAAAADSPAAAQQPGGAAAGAGAAAPAASGSKGKRKLPAAQQQQLPPQDAPPAVAVAAAPAPAGDSGKKKPRKSTTPHAPKQPKQQPQQQPEQAAAFGHGRQDSETMAAAALVGLSPEPKHQHAHHHQHPHAQAYAQYAAQYHQQYYGMPPGFGHPQHQQHAAYPPHLPAPLPQGPPPGPPYALPAAPIAPMAPPAEGEGAAAPAKKKGGGGGSRGRKSSTSSSASSASPAAAAGAAGAGVAGEAGFKGAGAESPAAAAGPTPAPPVVDDDTQENPFLAPWKEVDSDALARGMQSYAVWTPGNFAGFAPDDTRPAPGDEAWANGGEGTGAQGRPGRKASGRKSMRVSDRLHEIQQGKLPPHTLLICEEYGLKADGGVNAQAGQGVSPHHANASQPFHVKVHPDVAFLCDLHAHLADSEIIGFLAGRFDTASRTLFVQAPFPCRATARADDGSTDVEMDPGSEIEVRDVIDRSQMTVVGWYHSHPTFAPEPSLIDIENQHQYQQLMRDEGTGAEPFVGLIVGTYDDSVKQPVSLFRYFHVRRIKMSSSARAGAADSGVNFPMAVEVYLGHNNPEEQQEEKDWGVKKEEERAAAVNEEQKGAGMDLLAAVTSNLPALPTPQSPKAEGAAAAAAVKPEETNGNGSAAPEAAPAPAAAAQPPVPKQEAPAPAAPATTPAAADRRAQSLFLAVKEKRHRPLPPSKEIWASIEARFLAPESPEVACLRCTLETVRLLVEYYSRLPTRVDFEEEWRRGTSKGEKFELSLRKRVAALPGLGADPARRQAFLESLLEYIVAAWIEGTPRRLPQPEDFSGTRRERQKQAAAAREAVLAAEKEAAEKEEKEKAATASASGSAAEAPAAAATAAPAASASGQKKVPSIPPPPPPLEEEEAAAAAPATTAPPSDPEPQAQAPAPPQQPPQPPAPASPQPPAPQQPQSYAV